MARSLSRSAMTRFSFVVASMLLLLALPSHQRASAQTGEPEHAAMTFGSYFAAQGERRHEFNAIALAPDGNLVVTGTPRPKRRDPLDAQGDILVSKITPDGTVMWERVFDCGDADIAIAIDVDSAGNIYVLGSVYECDFPTTPGAYQETGECAGTLVKLTPDGETVYSTLLMRSRRGSCPGDAVDVEVDDSGSAWIVGGADGDTCAERGATNLDGAPSQVHLLRLSPDGSTATTNLCFGGSGNDGPSALSLAGDGVVYIRGVTDSTDFPVHPDAYQDSLGGELDSFIAAVDISANEILYGSYLGGSDFDFSGDLDLNSAGQVFISGSTRSPDHPMVDPDQVGGSEPEILIGEMSPDLSNLEGLELIPSGDQDHVIADEHVINDIEALGDRLYFAGETTNDDLEVVGQFQTVHRGGFAMFFGVQDFATDTTEVLSYLSAGREGADGVAVLPDGDFYVAGSAGSAALPVVNPKQKRKKNEHDAYLARFTLTTSSCDLLGGQSKDRLFGTDEHDVLCGFEGDDVLRGRAGDDEIFGHSGADFLGGGKGGDVMSGGSGPDQLSGNRGHDRLFGNGGHDDLRGGRGHDRLHGGRGNDTCDAGGWRGDRASLC